MLRYLIALILVLSALSSARAGGIDSYHGNYCGVDLGDPSFSTRPTDALDSACRAHDMCYTAKPGSCACDMALRNTAYAIKKDDRHEKIVRTKAGRIAVAMAVKPCG